MLQKRSNGASATQKDSIANVAKYATPQEAAEILEVRPRTIRRMLARGELQGARVGGQFKISRASIADIVRRIEGVHSSVSSGSSSPLAAAGGES